MKTIKFLISIDPLDFGPEATPQDMQDYAGFAHQYLLNHGYDQVEIEFVPEYPKNGDSQIVLRKQIWTAYRAA